MKSKYLLISIVLMLTLALTFNVFASPLAATSPTLGAVASYSVLAGSEVTNAGTSNIIGNVGISPGIGPIPHFIDNGTAIVGPPGVIHDVDVDAASAQANATSIYGELVSETCDQSFGAVDLATTFPAGVGPGVYCSTSSFSLTGNLNLIGSGVWIFKTVSGLTINSGASVTGGDPCNVWWQVGSTATLDTTASVIGNIFALTSITMANGATLNGRALAQTGEVTLIGNTILGPVCAADLATATAIAATATAEAAEATATAAAESTATAAAASRATTSAPEDEEDTPTATATLLPVMTALPGTGGAPIRSEGPPWALVVVVAGLGTVLLIFGVRAYRSTNRRKQ